MKQKLKRIVSAFCAAAMCAGMLPPVTASAAEASDVPINGYMATLSADTPTASDAHVKAFQVDGPESLENGVYKDGDTFRSSALNGKIWADKSVKVADSGDKFDVTLSALGQTFASTTTTKNEVAFDVVFVVDVSGSMNYGMNSSGDAQVGNTRMDATVKALNSAADTLMTNENNRMAVVTFSSSADPWVDLQHYTKNNAQDFFSYRANYNQRYLYFNAANQAETSKRVNSGTNQQDGFFKASDILTSANIAGNLERIPVVIMLTDGVPDGNHVKSNYKKGTRGDGSVEADNVSAGTIFGWDNSDYYYSICTAAYKKDQINNHYKTLQPGKSNVAAKFYTIGLGLSEGTDAEILLNPAARDKNIQTGNSLDMTINTNSAEKMGFSTYDYADDSFVNENMTEAELKQIFNSIISEISKVEGGENVGESAGGRNNMNFVETLGEGVRLDSAFSLDVPTYTVDKETNEFVKGEPRTYTLTPHTKTGDNYTPVTVPTEIPGLIAKGTVIYLRPTKVTVNGTAGDLVENDKYDNAALHDLEVTVRQLESGRRQLQASIPPDLMAYNVLNVKTVEEQTTATYFESEPIRFRYQAAMMDTAEAGQYLIGEPSQSYLSFMPKSEQNEDGSYVMPYYWNQQESTFDRENKTSPVAGSVDYVCQSMKDKNNQVFIYLGNNGLFDLKGKSLTVDIHWNDLSNIAGQRFENINVQLYRDEVASQEDAKPDGPPVEGEIELVGDPVTLGLSDVKEDNENLWSRLFEELSVYSADGDYYRYWLRFVPESEAEKDDDRSYTVDILDTDSPNHENGKLIKDDTTNTWWFCFRTQEDAQGESLKEDAQLCIEFKRDAETVDLTIKKEWDASVSDQPDSIDVLLYANGQLVNESGAPQTNAEDAKITISAAEKWTKALTKLPYYVKDGNGAKIAYNVIETGTAAEKYTSTIEYQVDDPKKPVITLTNHQSVDKTALTVVKYWDDGENQDNLRKSVTVKLTAKVGDTALTDEELKTLTEPETLEKTISVTEDGASVTWENLPKVKDGQAVTYSAVETTLIEDYTPAYSKVGDTVMITNTHTPEAVNITVNKDWVDKDNQDGIRPESVSGVLYRSTDAGKTITPVRTFATQKSDGKDTVTIRDLPKYADKGQEIKYYVSENEVKGYDLSVADVTAEEAQDGTEVYPVTITDNTGKITLINTHPLEMLTYTVDFVWDDNNNRDKQRPKTMTLTLTGTGDQNVQVNTIPVTLTVDNSGVTGATIPENLAKDGVKVEVQDGKLTISGLYAYQKGVRLDYSAALSGYGTDYTAVKTAMTSYSSAFTLSYETKPLTLSFTKQWKDDENALSARPNHYAYLGYLTLKQNDVAVENPDVKAVQNEDGTYTITYSGLDKYDENNKPYTYTVTESTVPGYTADKTEVVLTGEDEKKIINTYTYKAPVYETITVEKVWDDADGNKRPAIPENAEGDPLNICLYLTDGSQTSAEDGIQPDSIVQKTDDANVWVYTWNNVPKTDPAGKELMYTAYEGKVPASYTAAPQYVNINADGVALGQIKNTLNSGETATGSLIIEKVWDDRDYTDKRPDSLTFTVTGRYADDKPASTREIIMTKGEDGAWMPVTMDNLPLSVDGNPVTYTVTEQNVPVGYTATYSAGVQLSATEPKTITVTNTYTPDTFKLTYNGNGAEGTPPVDSTMYTKVNNQATLLDKGKLTYEGMVFLGWSESITPIVTTKAQKDELTILAAQSEYIVTGNTTLYAVWALDENRDNKPDYEQKTVTVNIVWDDGGNVCGIRPTQVGFTLAEKPYTVDLTGTTGVLVNTNDGNTEWTYVVPEKFEISADLTADMLTAVAVEAKAHEDTNDTVGYTSDVAYADDVFTITLKHTPETTTHTVNKTWKNNSTEVTPTGATVVLLANGVRVENSEKTLTYDVQNAVSATWSDLSKYEGGHLITYHAIETAVPGADGAELMPHFKVAYVWDDANHQTDITNTFTDKRSITMLYEWDDDNNAAGTRPTEIEVQLYNGEDPVKDPIAITPDENGNWSATWDELPKDGVYTAKVVGYTEPDGTEHTVSPEESDDPLADSGYDFQMLSFGGDSVFVMESALDNTADVTVTKAWNDAENEYKTRPQSIWVNLLKDGVIEKSAELTADDNWQHTWTDLPEYENGEQIAYTVEEIPVPGYTPTYEKGVITNKLNALGNDLTVTYVYNNGQQNTSESVPYGGTAKGNIPTWDGHVFKGWYTDNGTFKTLYDFKAAVTKDITLYAKWVSSHDGKEDENDHHFLTFVYQNASAKDEDGKPIDTSQVKIRVDCKSDFSFTAAANSGYILKTPSIDPKAAKLVSEGNNTYTLENITGDLTVTITAERKTSGGGGGGGGGGGSSSTKPQLEKGDHFAYVVGYEDGTVRPGNNITRAEVAAIFFRLLTDESREEYYQKTNDFSDVMAGKWYNNAVSTLSNAGIINGYPDGTFRPNAPITRAELATIASKFDDLEGGSCRLTDIAGHWAEEYIISAYTKGWVGGYPDGTFLPDKSITRAEVMTLVNNVLERHVKAEDMLKDMLTWIDNPKTAWYYEAVQEATNSHDYSREKDETYEEWTKITPPRDWSKLER